jgi:hypothetical protein
MPFVFEQPNERSAKNPNGGGALPANRLDILRPSVNNLSTRIFVRAGAAYGEPAADVRGYIQSVKAKPVGA